MKKYEIDYQTVERKLQEYCERRLKDASHFCENEETSSAWSYLEYAYGAFCFASELFPKYLIPLDNWWCREIKPTYKALCHKLFDIEEGKHLTNNN